MNGLLTALLGGAQGTGQGLQYQDEQARKDQQTAMEQAKLRADLAMQGFFEKPKPVPQAPEAPQLSGAGPQSGFGIPDAAQVHRGVLTSLLSPKNAQKAQGAMSATDAMRQAVAAPRPAPVAQSQDDDSPTIALPGMGDYTYDFGRSRMGRQVTMEGMKKRQDYVLEQEKIGDQARRLRAAHPELTEEQSLVIAQSPGAMSSYADPYNEHSPEGRKAKIEDAKQLAELTSNVEFNNFLRKQPYELRQEFAKAANASTLSTYSRIAVEQMLHKWNNEKTADEQRFQREQQDRSQTGSFLNNIAEKKFTQKSQIVPNLLNVLGVDESAPPPPTAQFQPNMTFQPGPPSGNAFGHLIPKKP